jgi:hypothetical protein
VKVADLRRRHIRHEWSFFNLDAHRPGQVEELVIRGRRLKANGSYAFLVGATDLTGNDSIFEVHRADGSGKTTLDAGRDLDPTSFRSTAREVSWVRGGVRKTARLR